MRIKALSRLLAAITLSALIISCPNLPRIDYGTPNSITIPNASFESPAGLTDNGLLNNVENWTPGGTWYGRFQSSIVPDGEYAVWSSYSYQGTIPDNGWSQELEAAFTEGKYILTVMTMADNTDGLVSRLYLGYDSGDDNYIVLDYKDVLISYSPDAAGFSYEDWITLTVSYEVRSGNAAIDNPIWIRMSTRTEATGVGGGSCWWDKVSLTVAYPLD